MAEPKKPDLTIHPSGKTDGDSPADPLEELIARSQTAREQARELNGTLREIIGLAKAQRKQDKGIRTELRNARGVLEKLRDIAA